MVSSFPRFESNPSRYCIFCFMGKSKLCYCSQGNIQTRKKGIIIPNSRPYKTPHPRYTPERPFSLLYRDQYLTHSLTPCLILLFSFSYGSVHSPHHQLPRTGILHPPQWRTYPRVHYFERRCLEYRRTTRYSLRHHRWSES